MKKVLILNYEFPPLGGGAGPVSYEIAKRYVKQGHAVDVVTMGFRGLPKEERVDGINVFRVPCLRSKKELSHTHEMFSYVVSAIGFLNKRLKKVHYDISHTHFIIPTGIVALWAKNKFGLNYILTAHGSDVPGFNTDRFKLSHRFTRPLLRRICNNADKIISPSDYLKDLIKENIHNYPEDKLTTIPNGIDPKKFVPLKKRKTIVSTGRLLPRKGFQHLIKAVSEYDLGWEIHIFGDGPAMASLKKQARRSKTKIVFHGWVDNNSRQYKDTLGRASIYCLLSLKENSSVALLEAMSAGCAVITTDVSGCPETIGDAGLTTKPGDIKDIQEKISYLIENQEVRESYQQKARERVLHTFDWNIILDRYTKEIL